MKKTPCILRTIINSIIHKNHHWNHHLLSSTCSSSLSPGCGHDAWRSSAPRRLTEWWWWSPFGFELDHHLDQGDYDCNANESWLWLCSTLLYPVSLLIGCWDDQWSMMLRCWDDQYKDHLVGQLTNDCVTSGQQGLRGSMHELNRNFLRFDNYHNYRSKSSQLLLKIITIIAQNHHNYCSKVSQ